MYIWNSWSLQFIDHQIKAIDDEWFPDLLIFLISWRLTVLTTLPYSMQYYLMLCKSALTLAQKQSIERSLLVGQFIQFVPVHP